MDALREASWPLIEYLKQRPHHPSWDLDNPEHVDTFLRQLKASCDRRKAELTDADQEATPWREDHAQP